uniref:Uncharacterized protein n=1 Tax=Arundo donax TaxID=35708 RepID=A0A0A9CEY5_ARUDO
MHSLEILPLDFTRLSSLISVQLIITAKQIGHSMPGGRKGCEKNSWKHQAFVCSSLVQIEGLHY